MVAGGGEERMDRVLGEGVQVVVLVVGVFVGVAEVVRGRRAERIVVRRILM